MRLFRQTRTREELYAVHYQRSRKPVAVLPIYATTEQRAVDMATSFGVRTGAEIVKVEPIDFDVLRFGAVLPKTIYV